MSQEKGPVGPTVIPLRPVAPGPTEQTLRSDALLNQERVLAAAREVLRNTGAAGLTMDAVAKAAGVGKGTVYRRWHDRGTLLTALLDHSETELQAGFLSGPPPLGPGAEPRERLLAFGKARIEHNITNIDLMSEAEASTGYLTHPTRLVSELHVRNLLREMGFSEPIDVLCLAVMAPLEPRAILHLRHDRRTDETQLLSQWTRFVQSLNPAQCAE